MKRGREQKEFFHDVNMIFAKSSKRDVMCFLSLFVSFFLPSLPPSFFLFLFAWGLSGCPAQPYSQKFLPLSCYQRVFGLCVHTCQAKARTKVWPFWGETMMVHRRQKHSLSLPRFFCSPYHAYLKFKSLPIFMSMLFEYGLWWVGRISSWE